VPLFQDFEHLFECHPGRQFASQHMADFDERCEFPHCAIPFEVVLRQICDHFFQEGNYILD